MDKERNKNQNHSEKPFSGREELVDGIFDKKIEWFAVVSWGHLYQELVPLQREGKITSLHYKTKKDDPDCFIVRFFITDKIKGVDLYNIEPDYFPSKKEEKSKKGWISWDEEELRLWKKHLNRFKKTSHQKITSFPRTSV